jgi:membrane protease YdiL (CAAX protease family)
LALVAGAEITTSLVDLRMGMVFHLALVLALVAYGALGRTEGGRRMALALTVAPVIRLLSLSLPLARFPQMAWYPMVSIPLLVGVFYLVRQVGVTRAELGLVPGKLSLQLMLAGGGLGIGVLEYAILQPHSMLSRPDLGEAAVAVLSLVIFTGFNEELIFRGLLQSQAAPVMKRLAPLYVSALFGVLHIGYLSVLDVVFVTGVGLLFAYLVQWGGSILGVTLAHGLTNIVLFIVMPYVAQGAPGDVATAFYVLAAGGTAIAAGALLLIRQHATRNNARMEGEGPSSRDLRVAMLGLQVPVNSDGR